MAAHLGLDAGLLIGREDKLIVPQRLALPASRVEIEEAAGLGGEVGIPGEDPAPVLPGADRIRMEPAPDRALTDSRHQSSPPGLRREVGDAPAGERPVLPDGEFTRLRLDLHDDPWGGKPGAVPGGAAPPGPGAVPRRSVSATNSPPPAGCAGTARFRRSRVPGPPAGSSWPGSPGNMATYTLRPVSAMPLPRLGTTQSGRGFCVEPEASPWIRTMPQGSRLGKPIYVSVSMKLCT
jgi:hypothetical protein